MMFCSRKCVTHCCNTVAFILVVLILMEAFSSIKATATTNQVHYYNDTCTPDGPPGQCITNNSHCLEYNNGSLFTCQCDIWDYKDKNADNCLSRPILQDITVKVSGTRTGTRNLWIVATGGTYTKNTLIVIVIQPPDKNGNSTFHQPWDPDVNIVTIDKLPSGTNFDIRLYIKQHGVRSGNDSYTSAYTKPEPPKNLTLTNIWERNLTVTWQNNTEAKCDNYTLTIDIENGSGTVVIPCSNDITSHTFNNLEGGTEYMITMLAHVPGYTSENNLVLNNFTRPKPVARAYIKEQQEHSLKLYMESNTSKDRYCLLVSGNKSETEVFAYNDTYDLTDLKAGTLYTIKIYTYLQGRKSETFVQLENFTRPEAPKTIQFSKIKEISFDMTWSIDESQILDEFVVSIYPQASGFPKYIPGSNETEYNLTVEQLQEGTQYTVHICTKINDTQSENCTINKTYTRPLPPSSVEIRTQLQTSIIVQFPADGIRTFDKYLVTFEDGSGQQQKQLIDRSAAEIQDKTISIIHDLNAGTSYTFVVFTTFGDLQLQSSVNLTVAAHTNESPLPIGIVPIELIHERNLTVFWQSVEGVDMYKAVLESSDDSHMFNKTWEVGKDFNNYTIVGLTPGTLYDGAILLVWTGLDSNINITLPSVYTRPTPPSNMIYTVEETSITITYIDDTWQQYVITIAPSLNSNNVNKTNIHWNITSLPQPITGLSVGTFYKIKIYSVVGNIQAENPYVIHMNTKPGSVSNILPVIPELNSSTMKIQWIKPEGHVSFYHVQFTCTSPNGNSSISTHTYNTTDNSATMSGLDPGTFCSVTVRATLGNQNGQTINQNISISNNETAPAKVDNFDIINKTSKSILFRWTKPQIRNGIIRNYFVIVSGSNGTCQQKIIFNCIICLADQGTNSSTSLGPECKYGHTSQEMFSADDDVFQYNVTGLHPYRNYTSRIIAQTVAPGEDRIKTVQTLEDIPGIPAESKITNYTYNTVDLSWKSPVERNGVITAYTIRYKFYKKLCQNGITVEGKEQTVIKNTLLDLIPPTEMTINDRIFSYWNYTFSVTANTSVGEGSPFTLGTIRTLESEPSQTETVNTNTIAYAVNIHWSPPCFPNGILTNYKVCLTNISKDTDHADTCYDFNSDETETTVSVLPFRNYTVKVAAETSAGRGQFSKETYIETRIAAPAKPQELRASSTATDIYVRWVKPELEMFTGPTKYRVIAVDVFNGSEYTCETIIATWIDSLASSCIVRGLHPYTNYNFKVTAITRPFMASSTFNIAQTEESTPGDVTGLIIKAESDVTKPRTILVSWGEPAYRDRHGIITDYFVQYTEMNGDVSLTSKTDNKATEFLITNIQPGLYSMKVFAATSVGNGTELFASIILNPGAPIKMIESSGTLLMQPASTSGNDDQKQIAVKLPLTQFLCNRSNGEPTKWGVVVSQENEATDPPFVGSLSDFQSKIKQHYKNWFDVKDSDSIKPYIATGEDWKPNCPGQNGRRRRRSADAAFTQNYEIGSDGDCSGKAHDKYCNGELQPGRKYRVRTFACTLLGCTETDYSEPIATGNRNTLVPVIVGVVSAIVVITMVAGSLIYWYTRRRKTGNNGPNLGTGESDTDQNGPYMELDDVTRVNDYDKIRINANDSSRNTYLELNRPQSDVHVYEQAGVQENGITKPDDRLSNLKVHTYTTLAKILERLTPEDDDETWWSYILNNYDLDISRKEMRQLEHTNQPGMHLLDLLDERGYTQSNIEEMFINLEMRDALHVLRNY